MTERAIAAELGIAVPLDVARGALPALAMRPGAVEQRNNASMIGISRKRRAWNTDFGSTALCERECGGRKDTIDHPPSFLEGGHLPDLVV
jgi:hypothetical protein